MKRDTGSILLLVLTAVLSGAALGQSKQQPRNVIVNGQSGKAEVIDQNGRLFVDVLALASIGKGSVSFSGPSIVLEFPAVASGATTAGTAEPAAASRPLNSSALSQEFMKAGIEEIARLREWATTTADGVRFRWFLARSVHYTGPFWLSRRVSRRLRCPFAWTKSLRDQNAASLYPVI